MNNDQIIKLVKEKESSIINIWLINDLVELVNINDGLTLSNIRPSYLGNKILGLDEFMFTDEWLKNTIKLFPADSRGSFKKIKSTCERFIQETNCSLESIEIIIKEWLKKKEYPYHGKLENFFYTEKDHEEISRAKEMLELLEDKQLSSQDYRYEQA